MSDIAIHVENLSKQYQIGKKQEKYLTLRDVLANAFAAPFRRASKLLHGQASGAAELDDTIWALRDVSFEVRRGEAVGIIGRNGAGKSTLLKVLSRITEPTSGFADIYGRVGSLLEVGTGFHPELTGRENVYLSGAILGMTRTEIESKFDEIVAFSGVERFIDTPVKHYSSGMYLRLAFAVAAHLEPEILLVDEVLAVGDAAFQKKCLGKMEDVANEGRTVLFVSHDMGAISRLCGRCLWLNDGSIQAILPAGEAVQRYLTSGMEESSEAFFESDPEKAVQFIRVRVLNRDGHPTSELTSQEPIQVEMDIQVKEPIEGAYVTMSLHTPQGIQVLFAEERDSALTTTFGSVGVHTIGVTVPGNLLAPGRFLVNTGIATGYGQVFHNPKAVCMFTVRNLLSPRQRWPGLVAPPLKWDLVASSTSEVGNADAS
jgi:lipopolysaccharide transport system ATP-binding protein